MRRLITPRPPFCFGRHTFFHATSGLFLAFTSDPRHRQFLLALSMFSITVTGIFKVHMV
uniref:Uncharacterized protein n=1 Tax=Arundo donax TaxID=35708 RepID=A0A0A8YSA6_ARUDO